MNFYVKTILGPFQFYPFRKQGSTGAYGADKDRFGSYFFLFFFQRVHSGPLFGTVPLHFPCPSACGLFSAVSVSLALSAVVSKKQRVNALYPFLDSLRTVLFFIRSIAKLARVNGQFLSGPFQLFRSCKRPLSQINTSNDGINPYTSLEAPFS